MSLSGGGRGYESLRIFRHRPGRSFVFLACVVDDHELSILLRFETACSTEAIAKFAISTVSVAVFLKCLHMFNLYTSDRENDSNFNV